MFEDKIIKVLKKELKLKDIRLEKPPSGFGDYAFPCYALARKLKKNPVEIANELARKLKINGIKKIEAKGSYINLFVDKAVLAQEVINSILSKKEGYGKGKENKKIIVEYSQPNPNKPMHLGHVRNNSLGMAISNLLKFNGNKVVRINWINDRGIHICQSMFAYKKWGRGKKPKKKPDHFVGDYYVMFHKKVRKDSKLNDEVLELLRKWEAGDKKTLALWKKMNNWFYKGVNETYSRLGCKFDKWYYESKIYKKANYLVKTGLRKKIFFTGDDKAVYAELEPYSLPNKILIRSDGTAIYVLGDIALALEKAKLKPSKSIYVVGSEQNLYFQQLFKILELLKIKGNYYHLSYGMVYLPEGKLKSREGKVVDADDIIDEVVNLAKKELKKRGKLSKKELNERAEKIGLSALKFYMLKIEPKKDIYYKPEESISFEGETGPYCQYTYARINSILKKVKASGKVNYNKLKSKYEIELVKKLELFPDVIKDAGDKLKPSIIANYVYDLCQEFNKFYQKCPVKKASKDLRLLRLRLIKAVAIIIKISLNLLDIEVMKEM